MKLTSEHAFNVACKLHSLSPEWLDSADDTAAAWRRLPIEVLANVLDRVSGRDVCALAWVCSDWRRQIRKAPRPGALVDFELRVRKAARRARRERAAQDLAEEMAYRVSKITDELFISGDCWTDRAIAHQGITAVVTVLDDVEKIVTALPHLVLNVEDYEDEPIENHFDVAFEFIARHQCVLVHCAAGASRSPTIVIGYLMSRKGMTLRQAFDCVREKRVVQPNEGFMGKLMALELKLYGRNTVELSEFDFQED